jgi:hypothetical protein
MGTLDELLDNSRADLHLTVRGSPADLKHRLIGLAEVEPLGEDGARIVLRRDRRRPARDVDCRLAAVFEMLAREESELVSIEAQEHNLERLFLELTGRKLRD